MTLFEFAVPLIAIAVTLAGIAVLRHEDRKFDDAGRTHRTPAE